MAYTRGPSLNRQGSREPLLAATFRSGTGKNITGFWKPGDIAQSPPTTRLAGCKFQRIRLGCQKSVKSDCDVGQLPAGFTGSFRIAGNRPRKSLAGPGTVRKNDGRNDPGQRLGSERPDQPENWW